MRDGEQRAGHRPPRLPRRQSGGHRDLVRLLQEDQPLRKQEEERAAAEIVEVANTCVTR